MTSFSPSRPVQPVSELAEQLALTTLLNTYLREFGPATFLRDVPRHDAALATRMRAHGPATWLRIEWERQDACLYVPLAYYSATGQHAYAFPLLSRTLADVGPLRPLALSALAALLSQEAGGSAPVFAQRLRACVHNLALMLTAPPTAAPGLPPFLRSEQALRLGHAMHPLAKDRSGFDEADLLAYSPEFGRAFQLVYFLADPAVVQAQEAGPPVVQAALRAALETDAALPSLARTALLARPGWQVLPVHPWEARQLPGQPAVAKLLAAHQLLPLGAAGPGFYATSSVRTVYAPGLPVMLKLSLSAKLTNSVRLNHAWELPLGVQVMALLHSAWGAAVRRDFPTVEFIPDPAYLALRDGEELVPAFSTIVRHNPFPAGDTRRVVLLATWAEALPGAASELAQALRTRAATTGEPLLTVGGHWFEAYLRVLLGPLLGIYSRYGLALEAHQQNILLELDAVGWPVKVFFRDNQGYFFREGKATELAAHVPGFGAGCYLVHTEEHINPKYAYYLLLNNLLGLIASLGRQGLATEDDLLARTAACLEAQRATDETGLVAYLLDATFWEAKGNLRMSLTDMNEATQPVEAPAIYLPYLNPFIRARHHAPALLSPVPGGPVVASRRVAEYGGATLALRPFCAETDLPHYHRWMNEAYARPFWQLHGPLGNLETHYLSLQAGADTAVYTGLLDGEPVFTLEPYWAPGDLVGRYYDAQPGDYGLHLLLAPATQRRPRFSRHVLLLCLEFLFADPRVTRVICEADRHNAGMARLLARAHFQFQHYVQLPEKEASLTTCTRADMARLAAELRQPAPALA